ncbi:MAG: signal peptidase I [Syntrophobacteraceae bacterium]|jgi:signal peptidase I
MVNNRRRWWIAGLLSILEPGLGQIYNGQARKGLLILALPVIIFTGMAFWLNAEYTAFVLNACFLLAFVYYFVVAIDAIWVAHRLGHEYKLKSYNRPSVYICMFILVCVAGAAFSTFVHSYFIKAYKIASGSMQPTLLPGDHIIADLRPWARNPHKGDIIVFEYPKNPISIFVMRVVAVGGDTFEIRAKDLFVNGEQSKEAFIFHDDPNILPARDNYGPVLVPRDNYLVMGDNRDHCNDSRFWGFLPRSNVKGTVRNIYWSWDDETGTVRWNRIGMAIR